MQLKNKKIVNSNVNVLTDASQTELDAKQQIKIL